MWTTDLGNNEIDYEKTLYFPKTVLSHLDVVIDSLISSYTNDSSDSDIEITNVIPAPTLDTVLKEGILSQY